MDREVLEKRGSWLKDRFYACILSAEKIIRQLEKILQMPKEEEEAPPASSPWENAEESMAKQSESFDLGGQEGIHWVVQENFPEKKEKSEKVSRMSIQIQRTNKFHKPTRKKD